MTAESGTRFKNLPMYHIRGSVSVKRDHIGYMMFQSFGIGLKGLQRPLPVDLVVSLGEKQGEKKNKKNRGIAYEKW